MATSLEQHQLFQCREGPPGIDIDTTSTSSQSFGSSPSVRSNSSSVCVFDSPDVTKHLGQFDGERMASPRTPLMVSRNSGLDLHAEEQLSTLLRNYIMYRCSLNEHCFQGDFDETALDALSRMSFIQALQTVEHYSASVSPRIQKRSAYLMGILRGQEAHWDRFVAPNSFAKNGPLKGREILRIPSQLLLFIGQCCLDGNCLPSDFTPEVCMSLHSLPINLALKSVSAFNSNKRIVAGVKGGVINRARFFLRLIQNVAEQNLTQMTTPSARSYPAQVSSLYPKVNRLNASPTRAMGEMDKLCQQLSDHTVIEKPTIETKASLRKLSESSWRSGEDELNLEELADLDFGETKTASGENMVSDLQAQLKSSQIREQRLLQELSNTKQRLAALHADYVRMKALINRY